jgi:hypothetical protein
MIKKILSVLNSSLLVMALSACASLPFLNSGGTSGTTSQTPAVNTTALTLEDKLAVGTLKLEGTDKAVTAQQAKDLLFLWKAVKTLGSSSSTSSDEVKALYKQIEEAMTSDQVQAIQNMTMGPEDTRALMQQYNVRAGANRQQGSTSGQGTQSSQGNQGGFQGGPPGGGFPGGDFPGGQQGQRQVTRTPAAGQTARNFTLNLNALFADPLINLLEQRAKG